MSEVAILLDKLPAYKGDQRLVSRRQDTFDIIREIMSMHGKAATYYDRIAADHWKGNEMSTARGLFDFMRQHVPYKEEGTLKQTVKYPQAILEERYTFGNDCKHYAGYIIGIGAALNRMGYPVKCFYRFGCYRSPKTGRVSKAPGHVFAVYVINGREVWIDPVPEIGGFDSRAISPEKTIDRMPHMSNHKSIGSLYEISGLDNSSLVSGPRQRHHHHHGGGSWLDEYYGHHDYIGKAKKKHKGLHLKIKAPHIKIQPGKLLKKLGGAAPRNAYLALLKMNFDNLAVNIHNRIKNNPAAKKKLEDFWRKVGGNTNKLSTAINGGVNTHNKLHPHKKVTGMQNVMYINGFTNDYVAGLDTDDSMGVVALAGAAALLAAAAPIIAAIKGVLKSMGVDSSNTEAAADGADVKAAQDHNNATQDSGDGNADINPDGSVDHGNGVTTKVTKDSSGQQTMHYDVKDPTAGDTSSGDDGSDQDSSETKSVTKTHKVEDTDGDGQADTDVDTTTKTVTKSGAAAASFSDMWDNVKGFVDDHKAWFIGGGIVLISIIIIPKLFGKKTTRRRR